MSTGKTQRVSTIMGNSPLANSAPNYLHEDPKADKILQIRQGATFTPGNTWN